MKIHAALASILLAPILAASTPALADEVALRHGQTAERGWHQPSRLVWSPLSQMISANRTNVIRLDERRDDLRAVRLQSGAGATYIYSLTVQLEDGSRQDVNVGKWLYWDVPKLAIDLPNRRAEVDRITIHSWTWYPSTFQVFGQHLERPSMPLPPPPPAPPLPSHGTVIGKDLTFANSGGYVQLPVGAEKGRFGKVRIEATGAMTYVGRVYVTLPDGTYQTLEVGKPLARGQSATLDLTGNRHAIRAVTVMAGDDLGAVGHAGSRFTVTLL